MISRSHICLAMRNNWEYKRQDSTERDLQFTVALKEFSRKKNYRVK